MNNGDSKASPIHWLNQNREGEYTLESDGGLTKREAFAMAAMQGILSNPYIMEILDKGMTGTKHEGTNKDLMIVKEKAYRLADLMTEEES